MDNKYLVYVLSILSLETCLIIGVNQTWFMIISSIFLYIWSISEYEFK